MAPREAVPTMPGGRRTYAARPGAPFCPVLVGVSVGRAIPSVRRAAYRHQRERSRDRRAGRLGPLSPDAGMVFILLKRGQPRAVERAASTDGTEKTNLRRRTGLFR